MNLHAFIELPYKDFLTKQNPGLFRNHLLFGHDQHCCYLIKDCNAPDF
jgi:hypothetical protein